MKFLNLTLSRKDPSIEAKVQSKFFFKISYSSLTMSSIKITTLDFCPRFDYD